MRYAIQVITLPVSDVDVAKAFYVDTLGFAADVDWSPHAGFRVVQVTPPGSAASVQFGVGLTSAAPGSSRAAYLVVDDIESAHAELSERGADPGPLSHKADPANWAGGFADGMAEDRADYQSCFSLADPDGNTWIVQEIGYRRG